MNEVKLYKKPFKGFKLLGVSTVFVAIGILSILKEGDNREDFIMGWLTTIFFSLGIVFGLYHMLDRRPQLILNEIGIWDRTMNQNVIPWGMIEEAHVIDISGQKMIALELNEIFENSLKGSQWVAAMNRKIGAQKVNLQLGQLSVNPDKFIQLIMLLAKAESGERAKALGTESRKLV